MRPLRATLPGSPRTLDARGSEDDLFEAIGALRATPRQCVPLVAAAGAGKLISALGLFAILSALGVHLGPAMTVVIFVLTLVASAAGPFPAGLGTTEASLGALLVAQGVAGPVAVSAVLLFRFVDLWLPIAVGGVAAILRATHSGDRADAGAVSVRGDLIVTATSCCVVLPQSVGSTSKGRFRVAGMSNGSRSTSGAGTARLDDHRVRESGGTGLRLTIRRDIIRAHGGDITVTGNGPGTRITIWLPRPE